MNELREMMLEGPRDAEMNKRIQAWLNNLRHRYEPRVIGQRPCTKLYNHYIADFTRLPHWDTLQQCSEYCTKYVTTMSRCDRDSSLVYYRYES